MIRHMTSFRPIRVLYFLIGPQAPEVTPQTPGSDHVTGSDLVTAPQTPGSDHVTGSDSPSPPEVTSQPEVTLQCTGSDHMTGSDFTTGSHSLVHRK